ncbi:DUF3048 domain-containing protein [Streptomyces sp. SCSIO ZS0520]|uniref:DUF3048 domain-containing protein n=1 Tax=Streptomyces sp. SCSIO ZS0520 TaxID=2892996 RepID=UPI0021D8F4CE|nr:DUF3048 domain-containing protein [Streptomyces sp. SCSIO ZS0520]
MHKASRGRGRLAVVAAALLAVVLPACTPEDEKTPDRSGGGGPVLAVKIDNVGPARPQTGVESADVVYVERVEAGLSRLMALYATRLPKTVGPVRSARESDLELLRQFEDPVLAFSGAQSKLLPVIGRAPLRAVTPGSAPGGAFFRDSGRAAPHNLYLHPDRLLKKAAGKEALRRAGVGFGPRPDGGTALGSRTVGYPSARFSFDWSAGKGRWLVSMDGRRATAAGGAPLAAATVVVQYVKVRESGYHDVRGSNSPYSQSTGSGRAQVLRDGRAFEGRWQRPAVSSATEFTDPDGGRLPFAEGPVWIVLAEDRQE